MFAYCLNNPVNASDPTGHSSSTDADGNGIPDYQDRRWRELTLRVKKQYSAWDDIAEWVSNAAKEVWRGIKVVAVATYNSLDVHAGIGMGLYGERTLFDIAGFGAGIYGNLFAVELNEGKLRIGTEYSAGICFSLIRHFGAVDGFFQPDEGEREDTSWAGYDKAQNSVDIFGGGGYFFAGANYSIGFNFARFFEELSNNF